MKINRGALIFGGLVIAIVLAVAGMVWFSSLFKAAPGNTQNPVGNFFSSLFPFGAGTSRTPDATGTDETDSQASGPAPVLREITTDPVTGFRFQTDGTVRFVKKESGHFFETKTSVLDTVRISNTTIPGTGRITWLGDTSFILQYADENDSLRNFFATLASSTPDQTLNGSFLSAFTESYPGSDEKHALEVTKSSDGIDVELVSLPDNKKAQLFRSPLRGWTVLPTRADIFIETSPSSSAGFLYRLVNGSLVKVAAAPGLMALPRQDGAYIAYSSVVDGTMTLSILDTSKNTTSVSPISTVAEKCAWLPGDAPLLFCGVPSSSVNFSIEDWYMGLANTADTAWVVDARAGTARIVNTFEGVGHGLDIVEPEVSPDGGYAVFKNKSDLSLWSLSLQ